MRGERMERAYLAERHLDGIELVNQGYEQSADGRRLWYPTRRRRSMRWWYCSATSWRVMA